MEVCAVCIFHHFPAWPPSQVLGSPNPGHALRAQPSVSFLSHQGQECAVSRDDPLCPLGRGDKGNTSIESFRPSAGNQEECWENQPGLQNTRIYLQNLLVPCDVFRAFHSPLRALHSPSGSSLSSLPCLLKSSLKHALRQQ